MKEKLLIRLFVESDAKAVQAIIHRGLREINRKDYPAELIEEYCACFTLEKIKSQADSAHMYVAVFENKIVGTGTIAPYWKRKNESILLTIYVLPEMVGQGIGTAIINALEQDEFFLRANRIEIPSSTTAVKFYQKMGYVFKNGSIPDDEGLIRMEKFRNVKLLSEMTLEELWQLFPIVLSEHDPEWKNFYKSEADFLQKHFGKNAARIRHVGSTSVKGLLAKPTVDILLEVADNADLATVRRLSVECGYTTMAETTVPEYRLDLCKGYTPLGFAEKVFHLHIRHLGDWDEPYFCEYLNQNPEKAKEYADLKMKLQTQFKYDRDAYTEAKGEFIRKCVKAARNIK
ncbi:MAG: GNAT family N-acetyltransferase [Lentisphaerae bacterium]|nr:GNAT family N-acetyltransferase [Lentisphaerota bacterium]